MNDATPPPSLEGFSGEAPQTSGKAIASLILGLLACTCVTAIPGLIFGVWALADINARPAQLKGTALAMIGIILSGLGLTVAPLGILMALLLPAVQAGREAARRTQCANNLKQMGLALHHFHEQHGGFPPSATLDAEGNPPRSWRVEILPQLEERELRGAYRDGQPWDGPDNQALVSRMPRVYRCPSNATPTTSGETDYVFLAGDGAFAPREGAGPKPRDIPDGTSHTLAVVEAHDLKIPWSAPRDLDADRLTDLGSKHPGGAQVLFSDGSVRFLADSLDPETLRALATRAGGEAPPRLDD